MCHSKIQGKSRTMKQNDGYSVHFDVHVFFFSSLGSSGRAMLFHRAWNLDYSEAQHRDMMTGKHIVRDVMCRICHVSS